MSRCVSPLGSGLPLRRVLQTEAVCPCPRPRGHPGAAAPVLGSRPAGSLGSKPGWAGWVPMRGGTACLLGSLGPPRVNPQFLEDLHLPSQAWGGQRCPPGPAPAPRWGGGSGCTVSRSQGRGAAAPPGVRWERACLLNKHPVFLGPRDPLLQQGTQGPATRKRTPASQLCLPTGCRGVQRGRGKSPVAERGAPPKRRVVPVARPCR